MNTVPAKKVQANLSEFIEQVTRDHELTVILGGQACNAVLLSEQDWNAVKETVYLNGMPGLVGRIQNDTKMPLSDMGDNPAGTDPLM